MNIIASLVAGLIFGIGLLLSGMANPAKVLNFLDLAGHWDPSLAFVMGGAVAVGLLGYRLALRLAKPLSADKFHVPAARPVDPTLVIGAAIFGVGWGLIGFCPGPALVSLTLGAPATLVVVPAMLVGITLAAWIKKPRRTLQDA